MKRLLLVALPLLMLAPDTGGGSGSAVTGFTTDKPPLEGDFTPAAMQFREDHPELYKKEGSEDEKPPGKEDKKDEVGVDGHKPHPVFSESEHPHIAEGEPNLDPAPTDFDHLKQ